MAISLKHLLLPPLGSVILSVSISLRSVSPFYRQPISLYAPGAWSFPTCLSHLLCWPFATCISSTVITPQDCDGKGICAIVEAMRSRHAAVPHPFSHPTAIKPHTSRSTALVRHSKSHTWENHDIRRPQTFLRHIQQPNGVHLQWCALKLVYSSSVVQCFDC